MHPWQDNTAATQPGKFFIIISLQERYWGKKKKAHTLPRCKQQQLQLPCRNLCTSQCKVHQKEKNSIQVLKKNQKTKPPRCDLKPGTRKSG